MESTVKKVNKKPNKNIKILKISMVLLILGIGVWLISRGHAYYNRSSLIGVWISEETDQSIEFTKGGKVKTGNKKLGDYVIHSPNLLTYNIEGYTFDMNYELNGRSLIWGLEGNEEKFIKKGL